MEKFAQVTVAMGWVFLSSCGGMILTPQNSAQDATTLAPAAASAPFAPSEHSQFLVRLEWVSGAPQALQPAAARVTFFSAADAPAQKVEAVTATLFMPAHGHGSHEVPQVSQVAAGPSSMVDIANIVPTMSGQWHLIVSASVNGGAADKAAWNFDVP